MKTALFFIILIGLFCFQPPKTVTLQKINKAQSTSLKANGLCYSGPIQKVVNLIYHLNDEQFFLDSPNYIFSEAKVLSGTLTISMLNTYNYFLEKSVTLKKKYLKAIAIPSCSK